MESLAEVFAQGIEINRLFGQERFFGLAELSPACGLTNADPVVCFIGGSLESLGIHKSLQEMDRMSIDPFPIP